MSERLKNKVGLITGAAQGLGKEMARSMISQGANIIITDINKESLAKTAEELSCEYMTLDVTKEEQGEEKKQQNTIYTYIYIYMAGLLPIAV